MPTLMTAMKPKIQSPKIKCFIGNFFFNERKRIENAKGIKSSLESEKYEMPNIPHNKKINIILLLTEK